MMDRNETLAYILATFTAAQCLLSARHLRAAGADTAAGVWFEAADLFERALDQELAEQAADDDRLDATIERVLDRMADEGTF